jgi:glycosyltransferase involved in cell wall biosynthesis
MKKVLMIVYSLDIGGLERMVVNLANAIAASDYEPYICCVSHDGALAPLVERRDRLFVIGNRGRINAGSVRAILRLIRRIGVDVVHSHNTAGLLYGFIPAKYARLPIVHTIHGHDRVYEEHRLLNSVEGFMSRRVDRYVCVSRKLMDEMHDMYGVPSDRMVVLRNGVEPGGAAGGEAGEERDGVTIGALGRMTAVKNYQLLLRSFADVIETHGGCRLELVGGGEAMDELVALSEELGLGSRAVFRGQTSDPYGYLDTFDIFVVTSLNEGISISILEALSRGKICIVSDVGGNPEIIQNGENGFLFESGNRKDLVEKISNTIDNLDGADMDRIRSAARKTVAEEFSMNGMVDSYRRLYDAVAAR